MDLPCFTLASVAYGPHFQLSFQAIPTCAREALGLRWLPRLRDKIPGDTHDIEMRL